MSQAQDAAHGMQIVTISREYGSGGGEIAARLAARLGWRLVDHQVVAQVAQALGISEADAATHDEHVDSLALRLLTGLGSIQTPIPMGAPMPLDRDSAAYDEARRAAVLAAAATGQVVIVGRGAQALLGGRPDTLHVRIVAPLAARIAYVMRREGLDQPTAAAHISRTDQDRMRFLQAVHGSRADDAHLYDLIVNTGAIQIDRVVDLLVVALERKGWSLTLPAAERELGAGLSIYPQPPADQRPGTGAPSRA